MTKNKVFLRRCLFTHLKLMNLNRSPILYHACSFLSVYVVDNQSDRNVRDLA